MRLIETCMASLSAVCVQCRKKLEESVDIVPSAAEDETQNVTVGSALEEQSSFSFEAAKAVLVRIVTMTIAKNVGTEHNNDLNQYLLFKDSQAKDQ